MIWHEKPDAADLNRIHENTAVARLGIRITEVGEDFLRGEMPVDERTVQIIGLLHGGASVLFAETLGSAAATWVVNRDTESAVGTGITAHHVRATAEGPVVGTARPLHLGRTAQLWEIEIIAPNGKPVCLARLSTSVIVRDRFSQ
jgi:1,4-dihydroxy-2-naphthoyl-CoA hydrolase